MANTENIEAKLCAYIDGDLDAAGRAEIEKHLAANPQHRGLIEQLSRQRDLLRELPRENAPDEILDALQSQMERSVLLGDDDAGAEAEAMKVHRWPQLLAAAAIVILTVGLGAVIYFVLPRHANTGNYARVGSAGATLDATTAPADAGAAERRNNGFSDSSMARSEPGAGTSAAGDQPPPPSSVAMAPAPGSPAAEQPLQGKAPADVFAPAVAGKSPSGEAAIATGVLLDAQYRLQNADLAKQLKDAPGGLQDNAMFVVVSTADASAARSEVTNYLASNNIPWDSVAQPMPEPLAPIPGQDVSLSRSQNLNVRMKEGPEQLGQQQPAAIEPQETKSEAPAAGTADAEAAGKGIGGVGAPASEPARDLRTEEASKQAAAEPVQQPVQPGMADAELGAEQPGGLVTNDLNRDAGAAQVQATTQPLQKQMQQQAPPMQPLQLQVPQPAPAGRLIIARGMTKQQAAELSTNLAKQTAVQRAAVYEPRAVSPTTRAARTRMTSIGGGGTAAAPQSPTTSPSDTYEQSAVAPTAVPTTAPTDAAQEVIAATPTTPAAEEVAVSTTATAPAPTPLAAESNAVTEPATQPAGAVDERVDVVILVEDDVAPVVPADMEQPVTPEPTTDAAPTAAPATQEAPVDPTLP